MSKYLVMIVAMILIMTGCTEKAQDPIDAAYIAEIGSLESQLKTQKEANETLSKRLTVIEELLVSREGEIEALEQRLKTAEDQLQMVDDNDEEPLTGPPTVVETSEIVIELIKNQDFSTLSTYVHPTLGLRFTAYPFIDLGTDVVMTGAQVGNFGTDPTIYNWGNYDGSGDVINLNPMAYYGEFIYDEDFAVPEFMSWNSAIGSWNMINNMSTAYPTADYVEFHFTGFNPAYDGMDWVSLTLVFEQVGSNWYLVGIVHGQWTT